MPMSNNLIVNEVSYAFGSRRVLDRVSFEVIPGRITLLLGPNGAGKTTLFSLIAGLLAPQQGSITLPPSGRAGMSVVFQQPAIDLDLTVQQNLIYHAGLYGVPRMDAFAQLARPLVHLDLDSRLGEKVRNLNGGHRRRVEIVRALMTNPSLLLLDEPTAGLDAPTRRSLVEYLHRIAVERNLAVLWATHLTDEATPADDVIVLHQGKVRAYGNMSEVVKAMKAKTLEQAFFSMTQKDAA
jgi:ABC-2 type transport system ATP-binding protein